MKSLWIWILLVTPVAAPAQAQWLLPNTPLSGMGDPGNFYLVSTPSFVFATLNDDYLGLTDKLMTGSSGIAFYFATDNHHGLRGGHGFEFSLFHRLITPLGPTKFNQNTLNPQRGLFADELEPLLAYSYTFQEFKFEMSLGAESFGNYGGISVHDYIHGIVGSHNKLQTFGKTKRATYGEGSIGVGNAFSDNLLWMIFVNNNPVMDSVLSRFSFQVAVGELHLAAQVEGAFDQFSHMYDDIRPFRYGFGVSLRYAWYQATFNYQSIYLNYDQFGQLFFNPLVINLEF